ncbi:class I SAM-dependent methyltransferase, partial [Bacteroidota bacterium]
MSLLIKMNITELAKGLKIDEYGIWVNSKTSSISYPEYGNQMHFLLEDTSFWFRHRNNCIIAAIKQFPPCGQILDIGGGNGFVTRRLIDEGYSTVLLEPDPVGAYNAKTIRAVPEVICSTFEDIDIPPGSVSAVGCFDVIEHVEEDHFFLKNIYKILEPGGMLYIVVPAHQWLWSLHDINVQHYRRYNSENLIRLLEGM